jgi:hypothetical protein
MRCEKEDEVAVEGISPARESRRARTQTMALFYAVIPLFSLFILSCPPTTPSPSPGTGAGYASIVVQPTGSLLVSSTLAAPARNVWPEADPAFYTVSSYKIDGQGPAAAVYGSDAISAANISTTISGFAPGAWTFAVEAYNSRGIYIGRGTATATLAAGQTSTLSASIGPITEGQGGFSLYLGWSGASLDGTHTVTATPLQPGGAALSLPVQKDTDGKWIRVDRSDLSAGAYSLQVILRQDNTANPSVPEAVAWSTTEILYVAPSRDSRLDRFISIAEMSQSPQAPTLSGPLPDFIIEDGSGGYRLPLNFPDPASTVFVMTIDGTEPGYDFIGAAVLNGTKVDPAAGILITRAMEDSDPQPSDELLTVKLKAFNFWGSSPTLSKLFAVSDAVYVSAGASPAGVGTRADPAGNFASALTLASSLTNQIAGRVRVRVSSGDFAVDDQYLADGIELSGGWNPATWTQNVAIRPDDFLTSPASSRTAFVATDVSLDGNTYTAFRINDNGSRGLRLENALVLGPVSSSYAMLSAIYVEYSSAPVELYRISAQGKASASYSYGLSANWAQDLRISNSYFIGRNAPAAAATSESYGVYALNSRLSIIDSRIYGGYAHSADVIGMYIQGSVGAPAFLDFLGSSFTEANVRGNLAPLPATNSGNSYGIRFNLVDVRIRGVRVQSGAPGSTSGAYGIFQLDTIAVIEDSELVGDSGGNWSYGVFAHDNNAYPGALSGIAGLSLYRSRALGGGTSFISAGVLIQNGRAVLEDNQELAGGDVTSSGEATAGIFINCGAGVPWVAADIRRNTLIRGGQAPSGSPVSAGIWAKNISSGSLPISLNIEDNVRIQGGDAFAVSYGIYLQRPQALFGPSSINPLASIRRNDILAGTAFGPVGLMISSNAMDAPLLVENNRIWGGIPTVGMVFGVWINNFGSADLADIVLRNNIIQSRSSIGAISSAVYAGRDVASSSGIYLMNNTLIAQNTTAAQINGIRLGANAGVTAINNLIIALGSAAWAAYEFEPSSDPVFFSQNAFISTNPNPYYDDDSSTGIIPSGNFTDSSIGDLLTQALPMDPSSFYAFTASLTNGSSYTNVQSNALNLDGATAVAQADPWYFSDDFDGTDRNAGSPTWSIGAQEYE